MANTPCHSAIGSMESRLSLSMFGNIAVMGLGVVGLIDVVSHIEFHLCSKY